MKIFINARFLTQNITGVQRYAIELVKSLNTIIEKRMPELEKYSFIMLSPKKTKYKLNLKNIPLKRVGYFTGHLWEQLELPLYARDGLLLNLCNTAPILKSDQIITIHDTAVFSHPSAYSWFFRNWYRFLLMRLGAKAKKVITVSFFSRKELIKHCRIKENILEVIYEGREHVDSWSQATKILARNNLKNENYILAVSSMNPNKNFQSIIKAINLLKDVNFDFVIAGGINPKIFTGSKVVLPDYVKHVGYVSDSELRVLYENAACFVYPSLYEGFGLPPLEAMACGCPVIVSNVASLPEVCGDAALYCDPYDPKDIADKIRRIMNDSELRETLKQKGLERAGQFSWEKCAQETWKVIEEVLAK